MSDLSFRESLYTFIEREAQPREKFGHQPRLYALTRVIGAGYTYDDDVVYAAVFLHDIGVFHGHRPEDPAALATWDNTAYAVSKVPQILKDLGFAPSKISSVVEAVRTHQPSGQPAALEGKILRDADILEQLGAVGILRTVSKVGRDTRFHDFTSAAKALTHALDTLPDQLLLPESRLLAVPRVIIHRKLLVHLENEAGALLL